MTGGTAAQLGQQMEVAEGASLLSICQRRLGRFHSVAIQCQLHGKSVKRKGHIVKI